MGGIWWPIFLHITVNIEHMLQSIFQPQCFFLFDTIFQTILYLTTIGSRQVTRRNNNLYQKQFDNLISKYLIHNSNGDNNLQARQWQLSDFSVTYMSPISHMKVNINIICTSIVTFLAHKLILTNKSNLCLLSNLQVTFL